MAKLRTSDRDAADGSKEELERLVRQIRDRWPDVKIIVRGDSGFCRNNLMSWCESNDVKYIFGIAKNSRLLKFLKKALRKAKKNFIMKRGDTKNMLISFTKL